MYGSYQRHILQNVFAREELRRKNTPSPIYSLVSDLTDGAIPTLPEEPDDRIWQYMGSILNLQSLELPVGATHAAWVKGDLRCFKRIEK